MTKPDIPTPNAGLFYYLKYSRPDQLNLTSQVNIATNDLN